MQVTIEKNGGCNHMFCKSALCKYEFCWVCLGPWSAHADYYKCNRFDEQESMAARGRQEETRAALSRYIFHWTRYVNHKQSLRLEHKLSDAIGQKMAVMQENGKTWIEVQFLRNAVDVLRNCRRTLMYTYPFAYFLKKNNQQAIFEVTGGESPRYL